MNNLAIFEEVAAGKLTPEQASKLMLDADERAKTAHRPSWAPKWAWVLCGMIVALLLAAFGVERRSS